MSQTLTIAKRELTSLFFSPIAYVVVAIFGTGAAMIFMQHFGPGSPAEMRGTFEGVMWLLIPLVPAVSMRLLSEEIRSGTMELLMTSPVTDTQVIMGKWLGAMGFMVVLLSPLVTLLLALEFNADPDLWKIATGLFGMLLVGALYMSIGTFASAVTENQIISWILSVFVICMIAVAPFFLPRWGAIPPSLREPMFYVNVTVQYQDFSKGLVDVSNFLFFVSGIALFLFLAVVTLQSKRWR